MKYNIIKHNLNRLEFAAAIVSQLNKYNVSCVLVGGSCVSIYTKEKFVSDDLDFISPFSQSIITKALTEIGFEKEGRYYIHPNSKFYVEFPSGPLAIGNRTSIKPEEIKVINGISINMLSPTQSVMDRLASWYHWSDRRSLLQAIEIAKNHIINFAEVEKCSAEEGEADKYQKFLEQLHINL